VQYEEHFPNGSVIELRSQPMPSGGFVTSYTDLTDRRAIERQLRQAQRMEAVGQLTGGIAHDFNNLLAAVSANLQMLHGSLHRDEKLARRIVRALEAVERGSTMTQRLLAFSRQQALRPEVTDINLLIEGVLDLVGYGVDNGIEVRTELSPEPVFASIDPGQLEDAILNLVFNSRDAMPEGGLLSLTTRMILDDTQDEAAFVRIGVADSGVGMPPDVMARAYEPFFTTKEIGHGTGLGLSMVYGFVRQSGGNVTISSTPDKGTEVAILLPAVAWTEKAQLVAAQPTEVRGAGERVLVVEDDAIVRETVVDMIESLNYAVESAANGAQALALIERCQFDLLFTDVMLPDGMTGLDVASRARRIQPGLKVLYTSGYALRPKGGEPLLEPGEQLIEKPYRKVALAVRFRQVLDNRP
jgi:nitrogen-specific signal transduction histidine kinase